MYDNCRIVLKIPINTFCGQDKLHKLMSVDYYKNWSYQLFNVSAYIIIILKFAYIKYCHVLTCTDMY